MTYDFSSLPSVKDGVRAYGLSAKKSLGQNFLFDSNLTDKIASEAFARYEPAFKNGTVFEVGSGPGGLTRSLLKLNPKSLIAVEKDERFAELLAPLQTLCADVFHIKNADAMSEKIWEQGDEPRCVVANLPYNVGTPLLVSWLKHAPRFSGFVLMFQKEVARRITAAPKTAHYGRLAIFANWLCDTKIIMNVPKTAFTPPPKVDSAVVAITPRAQPLFPARMELLERVTNAVFSQRRKMLRVSLKQIGDPKSLCDAAGICETARPEELPVEAFCALARALEK